LTHVSGRLKYLHACLLKACIVELLIVSAALFRDLLHTIFAFKDEKSEVVRGRKVSFCDCVR